MFAVQRRDFEVASSDYPFTSFGWKMWCIHRGEIGHGQPDCFQMQATA
jgi:hypothetical protein